ncbi:uncharacterized protein [Drosophila pseudoobscura]|uniref:Uncharacterized protein n=1 Tax=Drosophila pseudoobscura pseudoobscura TaxID=46245 RepID=A0A6I8VPF5_DROPS|nr:uncharacterized protein LOC117183325 [Drosophila pseudoobscura]
MSLVWVILCISIPTRGNIKAHWQVGNLNRTLQKMQSIIIVYFILISILLWLKLSGSLESISGLETTTSTARVPSQDTPSEINHPKSPATRVSKLLTVLKGSPARDNLIPPTTTPAFNAEDTTFDCYSLYGDDCFLVPDFIGPRLSAKLLKILS